MKTKIIHISEKWTTTVAVLKSKPRVLGKWAHVPHQIWTPENSRITWATSICKSQTSQRLTQFLVYGIWGPTTWGYLVVFFKDFHSEIRVTNLEQNFPKLYGFIEHQGASIVWIHRMLLQEIIHLLQDVLNLSLIRPRKFEMRAECMSWDFVDNTYSA